MMTERTSMDRLTRQPLEVSLGGQCYQIQPHPIRMAQAWRKKALTAFPSIGSVLASEFDNPSELIGTVAPDLIQAQEHILELMQDWEPGLPWETILDEATEEELLYAFWEVLQIAFPLFGLIHQQMNAMGQVSEPKEAPEMKEKS